MQCSPLLQYNLLYFAMFKIIIIVSKAKSTDTFINPALNPPAVMLKVMPTIVLWFHVARAYRLYRDRTANLKAVVERPVIDLSSSISANLSSSSFSRTTPRPLNSYVSEPSCWSFVPQLPTHFQ